MFLVLWNVNDYISGGTVVRALTIKEVAALAGVSSATITRVLQGDPHVSPETRKKVQEVLSRTGYQVNAIAQSLRTKRVATVAHVLHSLFPNPFYAYVARGLQREAAVLGYEVVVYIAEYSPKLEREAVQAALRRRVDALIFTTPLDATNVALAANSGLRVVQVERPTGVTTGAVTVDNYSGAKEATEHLISLGHRAISFIGEKPQGSYVELERLNGYLDAMHQAELRSNVVLGKYFAPEGDFEALGRSYAEEVLAQREPPTAIFAASDVLAAGVLQVLHARGIKVPSEVSVVGFDDTYAPVLTPALTTVAVPTAELGAAALRCAVVRPFDDDVKLGTQLVVRASTGPAPSQASTRADLGPGLLGQALTGNISP